MKRKKPRLVPMSLTDTIKYLESKNSSKLTVNEIQELVEEHKRHTIIKFLILEKVSKFTEKLKLHQIVGRLCNLQDSASDLQSIEDRKTDLTVCSLLKMLESVPEGGQEAITKGMEKAVKFMNKKGFAISELFELFDRLLYEKEQRCSDVTVVKSISAQQFVELCCPLLSKANPSVADLYNLLEILRTHSAINANVKDLEGRFIEAQDKLEAWLLHHPMISQYLDPFYVVVEPVDALPLPNTLEETVALLPEHIHRVRLADIGGANFSGVWRCPNKENAYAVAAAIRTVHGNGHGAGGAEIAVRIAVIQSNVGMHINI
jgi:hypothetical protein